MGKKKKTAHGGKRAGSGRPKKYGDTVTKSVLMPKALADRIKAAAVAQETNFNALVVKTLDKHVK